MQADGINIRLFSSVTMREIVHISAGGAQIRLRFTNEFGSIPLPSPTPTSRSAPAAAPSSPAPITPSPLAEPHPSTFLPAAPSSPIPLRSPLPPLSDVAVSFYLPPQIMRAETYHAFADQDNFVADGHSPAAPDLPQPTDAHFLVFF